MPGPELKSPRSIPLISAQLSNTIRTGVIEPAVTVTSKLISSARENQSLSQAVVCGEILQRLFEAVAHESPGSIQ